VPARIAQAADLARTPWKNGGGTTAEIAAFPDGSSLQAFGWRVSMADVESDGPFSIFSGIDRTLIVMEGNGIELAVGDVTHVLDGVSPRLSFPGDERTLARLLSGPIRDLNVMTRRGVFEHRARIVKAGSTWPLNDACAAFVVAMDAALDVTIGDSRHSLQALDTLILKETQAMIELSGNGRAVLIEIAPDVST